MIYPSVPYLIGFGAVILLFIIIALFEAVIGRLRDDFGNLLVLFFITIFGVGLVQTVAGDGNFYITKSVLVDSRPLVAFEFDQKVAYLLKTERILDGESYGFDYTFITSDEIGLPEKQEGFIPNSHNSQFGLDYFKVVSISSGTPRVEIYRLVRTYEGKEKLRYLVPFFEDTKFAYEVVYVSDDQIAVLPSN